MKQTLYRITRMDCPTEEQLIRNRLRSIEEVRKLDFDLMSRTLRVTHNLDDPRNIQQALEAIGMDPVPVTDETAQVELPPAIPRSEVVLLSISGIAALATEILHYMPWHHQVEWLLIALAIVSIATGGRKTIQKGFIALKTLTLNIYFLMTLAVAGAAVIGEWPEAAMVVFLFGLAEMIEAASLERARRAIGGLVALSPQQAEMKTAEGWEKVAASSVAVGDTVRVRPGERIPLDGTVEEGSPRINQAPITGESMPVEKMAGDQVFAGTINETGSFTFTVTAAQPNTTLARIIRAVQQAQAERAPMQRFIDRFAKYYTPGVVIFAVLLATLPPLFFGDFQHWFYQALVLLVIACPCALVISTPVTVVSGLATAAKHGMLIKGGVYLEEGRKLKVIALDKTGTLTAGAPVVTDVIAINGEAEEKLFQLAASVNAPSEHPVASAIVAGWTRANLTKVGSQGEARLDTVRRSGELLPVDRFEALAGLGATGFIDGQKYYIGNHRMTHDLGICGRHVESHLEALEEQAKTAVVLSTPEQALAVIGVADTLRATSIEAVHELHDMGVRTVMLTGDNSTTARAIAREVGIDDARGDLLPEDKLSAIDELVERHGEVGMVGDGINDAPALAKATIGFAMGAAGTDTALETADVALMDDDLRKLPDFIRLSRATHSILIQNIALAIGIKVVFFALALMGYATLWMAVFADMGASLLVVFNGLRLMRFKFKQHHACRHHE